MAFTFEFVLGGDVVKRVILVEQKGTRELRTSTGKRFGRLVITTRGVRLEMDEFAAKIIADAQFH